MLEKTKSTKGKLIAIAVLSIVLIAFLILTYLYQEPPDTPQNIILDFSNRPNLLPNGGFEEPALYETRPDSWWIEGGNGEIEYLNSSQKAHSGNFSMHLANGWNADGWEDRLRVSSNDIEIEEFADHLYLFHGWSRSENAELGQIMVKFKYKDSNGDTLTEDTFFLQNSTEWVQFNFVIETIPAAATQFSVNIQLDNSQGHAYFDDIAVYQLFGDEYTILSRLNKYVPPSLNQPKSLMGIGGSSTTLEQIDGVWWLVAPDGTPMWITGAVSIGLDPVENPVMYGNFGSPTPEGLLLYENNAKVRAKKELQFTSGVKDTLGGSTLNYIEWLNFGTEAEGIPSWVLKDNTTNPYGESGAHLFPDPFDPEWEEYATNQTDEIEQWFVDSPNTIGYWTDNEMAYGALYKYIWSNSCAHIFVDWLQGLYTPAGYQQPIHGPYATIGDLNTAWSSSGWFTYNYASFDEIRTGNKHPIIRHFNDTRVKEDLYAFERVLYKKYVDTVIQAIRDREDDLGGNHKLIISNRFAYDGPGFASNALKRVMDVFSAFDLIAVNAYPDYNRDRVYYSREYIEDMHRTFYVTTNRPIIIGEFGVAAEDGAIEIARWRSKTVTIQAERGAAYTNIISTLFSLPWTVGAFWFKWTNAYNTASGSPDPRNCGIVDDSDVYYSGLTDGINATNQLVNTKGRSNMFSLNDIRWNTLNITIIDHTMK